MNLFVDRNINFGRSSPEHNYAVNAGFFLETTNIFADLLGHIPTILYGLHVVTVKTLCIVVIESGLHRNDLFEFVLNRIDIFFLQYFSIDGTFVSVCRIYVPCAEHNVVELCNGNYFVIFKIFFVGTFSYTDFIVLSHRSNGLCQTLAGHQYAGHKCRSHCTESYYKDAKFTLCGFNVRFVHDFGLINLLFLFSFYQFFAFD